MELACSDGEISMKRLFAFLLITFFITACSLRYPPIEELLIGDTSFPQGWTASPEGPQVSPSAPFGGIRSIDRTMLSFDNTLVGANEQIERFQNSQEAGNEFVNNKDFLFREIPTVGPYLVPEELPYQSSVADRYYFACTRSSAYPFPLLGCMYFAQYGPYIVQFHIGWDLDSMSANDLEKILNAIDENMKPYTKW
jgi:hypothetical protein